MNNRKYFYLLGFLIIQSFLLISCAELLNNKLELGILSDKYGTIEWTYDSRTSTLTIEGTADTSNPFTYEKIKGLSLERVTEIKLGSNITALDSFAFVGFKNLKLLTIPSTVTSVGKCILNNINGVTVNYPSDTSMWDSDWSLGFTGILHGGSTYSGTESGGATDLTRNYNSDKTGWYTYEKGTLTFGGTGDVIWTSRDWSSLNVTTAIVEEGITSISYPGHPTGVFGFLSSLESVSLPQSLTSIESYTFYYCTALSSITIPSSVTTIGTDAFSGWTSDQTINLDWPSTDTTSRNLTGLSGTGATIYYSDNVPYN